MFMQHHFFDSKTNNEGQPKTLSDINRTKLRFLIYGNFNHSLKNNIRFGERKGYLINVS